MKKETIVLVLFIIFWIAISIFTIIFEEKTGYNPKDIDSSEVKTKPNNHE